MYVVLVVCVAYSSYCNSSGRSWRSLRHSYSRRILLRYTSALDRESDAIQHVEDTVDAEAVKAATKTEAVQTTAAPTI